VNIGDQMKKKYDLDAINFDIIRKDKIKHDPLRKESDRGCVLIMATDIENILASMLDQWFSAIGVITSKQRKNVFDFSGPAGTFSNKIALCKVFGFIDQDLYHDLNVIKDIRNIAAHSNQDFSLSSEDVIHELEKMRHYQNTKKKILSYIGTEDEDVINQKINEYLAINKEIFITLIRKNELLLFACEMNTIKNSLLLKDKFVDDRMKFKNIIEEKIKEMEDL